MLKFFRKYRLQLLAESKFRNYLLYAIGEIVLVVIGILFALKINNWNEAQKDNQLQRSYLKGIISDLEYDINAYANGIAEIEEHNKSINEILNSYKNNIVIPNDLLIDHLTRFNLIVKFSHRNTVVEDMKSSGRLNLIMSDSIRHKVIQYYKLASGIIENNNKNNDWILNHIIGSKIIIDHFDFNSTVNRSNMFPSIMKSVEVDEFSGLPFLDEVNNSERVHIINLLTAKNWLEGLNLSNGMEGKSKAITLKQSLDDYLKELEN